MLVMDTESDFDLEVLLGAGGTVDFTKGLSDEVKRTYHVVNEYFAGNLVLKILQLQMCLLDFQLSQPRQEKGAFK